VLADDISNEPSINFNPARIDYLGAIPSPDLVFIETPNGPFSNFAALKAATPQNPGTILDVQNSATQIETALIAKIFGLNLRYINGYASSTAQATGFLRGDGQLALSSATTVGSYVVNNQARALAIFSQLPSADQYSAPFANTPLISTLEKQYPPTTTSEKQAAKYLDAVENLLGAVWAAPTATPPDEVAALVAAVKWTLHNQYVINAWNQQGRPLGYSSGAQVKAEYLQAANEISKKTAIDQFILNP
jgi:tripartite-type tricarboxylate transporter receptor subunit TctC